MNLDMTGGEAARPIRHQTSAPDLCTPLLKLLTDDHSDCVAV